jgi:hypothetical protein
VFGLSGGIGRTGRVWPCDEEGDGSVNAAFAALQTPAVLDNGADTYLLTVVYMALRRGDSPVPALIAISDLRDSETAKRVPAGEPLNLQIQADGIAPSASYRIEVSEVTGKIVCIRDLKLLNGSFEEESAPGFSKGLYRFGFTAKTDFLRRFTRRAE